MLKSLSIRNLTVFAHADLKFSPQLNVIVGENSTGKSHLLTVAYSLLAASAEESRRPNSGSPTKGILQVKLAKKLVAVLRPETLGRLVHRQQGRSRCEIEFRFEEKKFDIDFSFATNSASEVKIDRLPSAWIPVAPVFFPTHELLTIYPGFVSLYDNHYLEFEETWRDTCVLLGAPAIRGRREQRVAQLLDPLEKEMDGSVFLEGGRFYMSMTGAGKLEMPLVAEGLRKLAMVAQLIATGSLLDKGYLFWDEPEAGLHPKLIRSVAQTILHLCQNGIQIFIATHSLFLVRELHIQMHSPEFKTARARFFGVQATTNHAVTVMQGNCIDDIEDIASLNEELSQSDRYLEAEE